MIILSHWRRVMRLIAPLVVGAWIAGVHAATPWPEVPFQYHARNTSVPKALSEFAKAFGLRLDIDPAAEGILKGDYSAQTPTQFLDTVASSHGLEWYHHKGVLYVTLASESVRRSLHVGGADIGALKDALKNLGIFDPKFGWAEFPDRGLLILSGPQPYVELVSGIVAEMGSAPRDGRELKVFPLKHARADDRTFSYRDQQVTTPGVVSILRNLMSRQSQGTNVHAAAAAPSAPPRLSPAVPAPSFGNLFSGRGTAPSDGAAALDGAIADAGKNAVSPGGISMAASRQGPVIEADVRLNAVIVHDVSDRMDSYAELIKRLDIPTTLIQIEAVIMDISNDHLDSLGIAWGSRNGKISLGYGDTSGALGANTITAASGSSLINTTLLSNATDFFLARVNALASTGDAKVRARPSVLTADNLVAVLDLSQTFYITTTGERVANVTPVTTGTLLKVTPRLVEDHGIRMVQLLVDIEDGKIQQTAQANLLPTVQQNNISTQAVVRENDALLIGGYSEDTDTKSEQKVPLLGDIPGIGSLFRTTATRHMRSERLFMIRPRIVPNPAMASADAPTASGIPEAPKDAPAGLSARH